MAYCLEVAYGNLEHRDSESEDYEVRRKDMANNILFLFI